MATTTPPQAAEQDHEDGSGAMPHYPRPSTYASLIEKLRRECRALRAAYDQLQAQGPSTGNRPLRGPPSSRSEQEVKDHALALAERVDMRVTSFDNNGVTPENQWLAARKEWTDLIFTTREVEDQLFAEEDTTN